MSTDPLRTARLDLEPVSPAHADEMVGLLADRALYAFYADEASPSLEELRERYARQAAGVSPDGRETWHSWILRERGTARCVGFVQATVRDTDLLGRGRSAELAWVVGTAYQGRGFATEAARAVLDHERHGPDAVTAVEAHIAEGNAASETVEAAVGLRATDEHDDDGERLWRLPRAPHPA